jgi:hypothetical protein
MTDLERFFGLFGAAAQGCGAQIRRETSFDFRFSTGLTNT